MAIPPNPQSRSDIGPISDTSGLGEPGETPASKATDASTRQSRPDAGEAVVAPEPPVISEKPLHETNGASVPGPAGAVPTNETPKPAATIKDPSADAGVSSTAGGKEEPRGVGRPFPALDYSKKHDAVEAELLERMRARYGTSLVHDMDDAQILLSYVTRNGLQEERKVDDKIIQTLISSREHMRGFTFQSETEELPFRKACGTIAKAAVPVTAASLRDSLTTEPYRRWMFLEPKPLPVAEIACRRYRALAILVLLFLLVFQIYWTAVSSILNKTNTLIAEISDLSVKIEQQRRAEPAIPPVTTSETTPQSVRNQPREDPAKITLAERASKVGELDAGYAMLRKLTFFDPAPTAFAGNDESAEITVAPTHSQIENSKVRTVAGQVVDVMQKWLLPLLYGALGAMVFVVRTLSMQARDRLFRREALVSLVLRVFLGMISGLAIGWFWNHNPAGSTAGALPATALSPFALAFVAGYGVELFFALLDKIVSTFTNK